MAQGKEAIHPVANIFNTDGTLNVKDGMAGLVHYLGQHAAGHVSIVNGVASETPVPGMDAVDISITFRRVHH